MSFSLMLALKALCHPGRPKMSASPECLLLRRNCLCPNLVTSSCIISIPIPSMEYAIFSIWCWSNLFKKIFYVFIHGSVQEATTTEYFLREPDEQTKEILVLCPCSGLDMKPVWHWSQCLPGDEVAAFRGRTLPPRLDSYPKRSVWGSPCFPCQHCLICLSANLGSFPPDNSNWDSIFLINLLDVMHQLLQYFSSNYRFSLFLRPYLPTQPPDFQDPYVWLFRAALIFFWFILQKILSYFIIQFSALLR